MNTVHLEITSPLLPARDQELSLEKNTQAYPPNPRIVKLHTKSATKLLGSINRKTLDSLTRSELTQDEDFHYVLNFPCPYDTHSLFNSDSYINASAGDNLIRKIFRIFETNDKPFNTVTESEEASRVVIQKEILEKWDNFKAEAIDMNISYKAFLKHVINTVLEILQELLKFKVEILFSRDDDELFVKIWASEENLKIHAENTDYLLQLRVNSKQESALSNKFSPYAPLDMTINLPGQGAQPEQIKNIEHLYKHYDKDDKQVKPGSMQEETSSLFCYKDKVRLIFDQMCTAFDPDYMVEAGLMLGHYPLHNCRVIDILKSNWINNWKISIEMDLRKVRVYFGEKIAIYFAWLKYYTRWMMFSAVIGIAAYTLQTVYEDVIEENTSISVSGISILAYTIMICLSASVVDLLWVRKEKHIALRWGTTMLDNYERQRPEFQGDYKKDNLTGRYKKFSMHPIKTSIFKVLDMGVVLTFVAIVLAITFTIFIWKAARIQSGLSVTTCEIVMGIQIQVMSIVYSKVVKWLNDLENYETMTEYNDALTLKTYLFQFVNCYASLFYIAFFKSYIEGCYNNDCMKELSDTLFFIFVVKLIANFLVILIPCILQSCKICFENIKVKRLKARNVAYIRTEMTYVEKQSKLDPYASLTDDYMEIIFNYGYVVLFSSAYPLLPFLALLQNFIEIKIDAWRLCHQFQRPMPKAANSIGIWIDIFRFLTILGAFTNTGILVFTTDIFDSSSQSMRWIIFLTIEHGILIFKYLLTLIFSTTPSSVTKSLIWSQRIVDEKIYGNGIDLEEQIMLRNLCLKELAGYEPITLGDSKEADS